MVELTRSVAGILILVDCLRGSCGYFWRTSSKLLANQRNMAYIVWTHAGSGGTFNLLRFRKNHIGSGKRLLFGPGKYREVGGIK
jgi:hypothetical protein